MAKTTPFAGLRALVTGASSGLGHTFAQQLAAQGANLVLVARRRDRLVANAAEIRQANPGCVVEVVEMDLTSPNAPQRLVEQTGPVDVLINNAGYGLFGPFHQLALDDQLHMLDLDIRVLTELTHRYLPAMRAQRKGYILLVASLGGYQPTPLYAAYSAAKAYVLNFGEAVNYELKGSGVHLSVLSPGITATEFLAVSGQRPTPYQRMALMAPEAVVRTGLRALANNRPSVVPGLMNQLTVFSNRLMPRTLQRRVAYLVMKN